MTDRPAAPARLLVAVAFLSGAAVMVVELAGIRLLAPVFGSSLYTWTALIGVVLIAFGVGGYLGGRLADRTTDIRALATVLYAAALTVALIPPLNLSAYGAVEPLGLMAGPTMLSLVLFTIPGVALGTVSPFVTRLLSLQHGDRRIGSAAGAASAAGTLGSFVGTFATGFVLVPNLGVRAVFLGTALVLAGTATLLLVAARVRPASSDFAMAGILTIGAGALWMSSAERPLPATVALRDTQYQRIHVIDTNGSNGKTIRRLVHDTVQQGALVLETDQPGLPYQQYWRLAHAYLDRLDRALVIGGGTFGIPRALAQHWPAATIVTLELDPDVVEMAERHFRFLPDERQLAIVTDARRFLRQDEARYDFVVGDAFAGVRAIPAHLVTREFFSEIHHRLAPGGVYLMNVIGAPEGPRAAVFDAIRHTLSTVFDDVHVYVAYERPSTDINNLLLVAGDDLSTPQTGNDEMLPALLSTRVELSPPADPVLLRDDFSPIEWLIGKTLRASP